DCEQCPNCPDCIEEECSLCTECSACPECEDCVECFVIERFAAPTPIVPVNVYIDEVLVSGSPFMYIEDLIAALEDLFPGSFYYEDLNNGSGNFHYYGPEWPDIVIKPLPDFNPYIFEDCLPEENPEAMSNGNQVKAMSEGTEDTEAIKDIEDCQNIEDLCLLFGAKLDSTQPVVNKLITTFSEHCITGEDTQQLTVNKGDRIYFRVHSV